MSKDTDIQYKDSGIPWLKEIPEHWGLEKAKYHFNSSDEKGNERPILLAATQKYGMIPQDELEGVVKVADGTDMQQFRTVHKYDFVISLRSFQGGFELSLYEGVCSPAYQVFRVTHGYSYRYLKYLFKSELFIDAMNALTVGIREGRNIKYSDFANSYLPIPPEREQEVIADFLDKETASIDRYIEEVQGSVDSLKKWKQSIIDNAVTKGIWKDEELVDSGKEGVGKISSRMKYSKIKYVAEISGRIGFRGYTASDLVDDGEGAITLSPSNLVDGNMDYSKCSYISWEKYDESPEIMIFPGDVLMVKTGASYGKTAYVESIPKEATINPQLVVFKDITINRKYFCYFMQSEIVQRQVEQIVSGGTIPTMSQEKMKSFFLFIPSNNEQEEIVSYLDNKCSTILNLIKEKERLLEDMIKYRNSLVYECVTGKRRVV